MNARRRLAGALLLIMLASCKPARTDEGRDRRDQAAVEEAAGTPRPTNPRTPEPPVMPPASTHPSVKIVDGTRVAKGALMGVMGLTRAREWVPSCTATLVAQDVALTAGHCFCGPRPTDGDGYVGDDASVTGGLYYKVVDVKPKPVCVGGMPKGPDLVVVRFKVPVRNVVPVIFAPIDLPDSAKEFRVVGFGAVDENATVYTWQKREAVVQKLSGDCTGTVGGKPASQTYGCRAGTEIVAGQRRSPDTCTGDSGGPLLLAADGTAGRPSSPSLMLTGVTSRSVVNAPRPCGFGGVYVRLSGEARAFISNAVATLKR